MGRRWLFRTRLAPPLPRIVGEPRSARHDGLALLTVLPPALPRLPRIGGTPRPSGLVGTPPSPPCISYLYRISYLY